MAARRIYDGRFINSLGALFHKRLQKMRGTNHRSKRPTAGREGRNGSLRELRKVTRWIIRSIYSSVTRQKMEERLEESSTKMPHVEEGQISVVVGKRRRERR